MIALLLRLTLKAWSLVVISLLTIPFAMIGGVFSLWLSGEYLSLPASIGFIALLGIAVLNGVMMMDTFNRLHLSLESSMDIMLTGARRRFRPVLMTAVIAALGLVPLLFATGPGSEIQRPLAIVIIGGIVTSTLLTLILLPLLYEQVIARRFRAKNLS
jgi:cobalt-zinc-cadmium resistance protein CzcA